VFSSGGAAPANGLGNLADELADAWGDDEEGEDGDEEPDMNFQEGKEDWEIVAWMSLLHRHNHLHRSLLH
jgi:hypothetical protein